MQFPATDRSPAQLLRKAYHSTPTDDEREYLLYLPAGYDSDERKLGARLCRRGPLPVVPRTQASIGRLERDLSRRPIKEESG
jgi:hypothetical protein